MSSNTEQTDNYEFNDDSTEWTTVMTKTSTKPKSNEKSPAKTNQYLEVLQRPYLANSLDGERDEFVKELISFIESNEKVLIVMRGLPGSGKSYLAS
jgi:hypothetical protein